VRTRHRTIDRQKCAQLFAGSLPIPPQTEAENERLIAILSKLDQREDLTPNGRSWSANEELGRHGRVDEVNVVYESGPATDDKKRSSVVRGAAVMKILTLLGRQSMAKRNNSRLRAIRDA
jgi:hypothetical protein